MPVSAPSSAVPVMPASSASRLHMTTTSFLAPVLIVKPSPLSQGNRYGYGYKNSNNGKRRRVTMVQNHNRNRNIPSSQDMMRPRMDPKVPPLGIPPPRRRRNVLPLASEVDFLLNHPVSELIVTNLVALSAIGFAVETVDLGHWNAVPLFLENAIASLFTAEYFLRWYGRNLSPRYLLSKLMLIDLVAILPLLLHSVDSTFLRLLRITRIFRLQRTMSDEWNDLFGDMTAAQIRLANVALTVLSIIYVSAGCFYEVERDVNPQILNFFDAFYYSTITLFTVGFGDIAPLTSLGRIVTVLTVLTGALLIPIQLTEVEKARRQAAKATTNMNMDKAPYIPPFYKDLVPFDFDLECPRCHLRGHQKDARYCRSCSLLLRNRLYDNK